MAEQNSPIGDHSVKPVGQLIKTLRKEKRLTQRQLADQAGVSFSFVNEVEGGKATVRLDRLNQLLKVFGYEMAPIKARRSPAPRL